ncbi:hypothetical protein FUA34_06270 [Salmonella enterica]|nr:hypothetical protein [Salmonella enterica]
MPLLCRLFSPVAPDAALPAHLTVCKATAPDGAVLSACRRPAARSPQTDFPGVHTRPHPVSVVQGRDVPATKLFAAGVKNFCVCPRTTAP